MNCIRNISGPPHGMCAELFTVKLAVYASIGAIAFFAMDYRVFQAYFHVARALACVYLLVQVVVRSSHNFFPVVTMACP